MIHFGHHTWLKYYQFKFFNSWKIDNHTDQLINEYTNSTTKLKRKTDILQQLINDLPNNVIFYQLKYNYQL